MVDDDGALVCVARETIAVGISRVKFGQSPIYVLQWLHLGACAVRLAVRA